MWHKSNYLVTSAATKEQIWNVLADVNNWNSWDKDIEWVQSKVKPALHTDFILKPKGGPKTRLTISKFEAPNVFADIAHLPLAKMHTTHTLTDTTDGVKIEVDIKVTGLLSFFWSKVIAQKQIEDITPQTQQLIAKAKTL